MSNNNDYTTGKLLGFLYYQICQKLIGIDLSRQTNTSIPQQVNFVGELECYNDETIFLSWKNSKKIF